MPVCKKITQGQVFTCDTPVFPGNEPEVTVINYEDISSLTKDGGNDLLITAVGMVSTTMGYQFTSPTDKGIVDGSTSEQGKYGPRVTQTVSWPIKVENAADKLNLKNLINGQFVVITKNKDKGVTGENKYHYFGELGGGKVDFVQVNDAGGDETSSLYICTFTAINQKPTATIYDTDEATTDAAVLALLSAAP